MDDSEWEAIHHPNSASTTATPSDEDEGDAVVVATPTDSNEPPIFPPSSHEGLPVNQPISATSSPPPSSPPSSSSSSSSSYTSSLAPSSSGEDESELPYESEAESEGLQARLGVFSSGVLRIAYGIRSRIGIWSIASVAAIVVVAAYGRRWQRRMKRVQKENRDRMMLLINQKDEKIKQLLIQIDQMNEILLSRRRVPVHRIVVDRPFIINKPRLNWN